MRARPGEDGPRPPETASRDWFPAAAGALVLAGAVVMLPHGGLHRAGAIPPFLAGAALMLCGFFCGLARGPGGTAWFWAVAAGARAILWFQASGDDIYRYVWEGRMVLEGWNPYLHPPGAPELTGLRDGLWAMVQHPGFTAIYPPLAQWIMAALAAIRPDPALFKAAFALADLGVVALLARRFGPRPALLYAWNPLAIYSSAGGGHYDSLFVLALVLGWGAWRDGKRGACAVWLGAAVALKWLALPILAWAVWRAGTGAGPRKGLRAGPALAAAGLGLLPLAAAYALLGWRTGEWPILLAPAGFSQFARSAEFLPGIAGFFWDESRYHNQWFAVPLALAWAAILFRTRRFETAAEWFLFAAFALSPMMHAWYFTWLLPFAVATRNRGTMAASASAFVYFILYHRVASGGGAWVLSPTETAALWLPPTAGFLLSLQAERPPAHP